MDSQNVLSVNYRKTIFNKSALYLSLFCFSTALIAEPSVETPVDNSPYQIQPTNSLWEEKDIDPDFYNNPYQISLFNAQHGEDSERLLSQTYTVFGLGVGIIGLLAVMPESVTNWESSDEGLFEKWKNNVSDGPVWDRDDWYLNYLAHPYFGGVFYQSARKSGYRQWDAFIYSFMMSTFYWEYGIEAFAEVPSIQDIVVTPVVGWVYGEWAFNTEREIWNNDGEVWGSEILGNTSLFLLDPVDSIGRNINYLFGQDIIKAGTGYFTFEQASLPYSSETENQIGLKVNFLFGADDSEAMPGISKNRSQSNAGHSNTVDPVDSGIVGLSAGGIWINLDDKWGASSAYGSQFSVGMYFTRAFSSRLNYSTAEVKNVANKNIRYENYGLDFQYYLNSDSNLRPFVTAGLGEIIWEEDNDQKRFQMNAGLGLHYKINDNWAIQSDWRHYYSSRTNTQDDQLGTAIIYRFGKGEWSL